WAVTGTAMSSAITRSNRRTIDVCMPMAPALLSSQVQDPGMRTRWKWLIGLAARLVFTALAVPFLVDEPMRRVTERQMNARLKGYTARIGRLDFHPLSFGIDFYDVVLTQDA